MQEYNDEFFMSEAIKEAHKALEEDEVPVGAIIVHQNKIIARAHNQREALSDPTAHAEMIAITQAANALGNWRLEGTKIYVTKEPCSMCAGAIMQARATALIFGTDDLKGGACGSVLTVINNPKLNHKIEVTKGVLEKETGKILTDFFKSKRKNSLDM